MKTYEILSFHPGRQHNFEQAFQIQKTFKNFKHLTSLHFTEKSIKRWKNIPKVSAYLNKRSSALTSNFVDTNPLAEVKLLLRQKFGSKSTNQDFLKRNETFQKWVVAKYRPPKIVIGYDTSSWLTFQKWKGKSFLILDLSIAAPQYKAILAKERGLSTEFLKKQTDGDTPLYDVYLKELELADLVLCGSEFVKQSCVALGINSDKLFVLPYGADLFRFKRTDKGELSNDIKVVFIGSVCYRKGADVLLESWKKISKDFPSVSLHFYGNVQIPIPENLERVYIHGHIPQDVLIKELNSAQISILPTFFEGSSLAIYQSMAMRLAVITTPNSGSIIENNRNGLLINYGSVEEIYASLKKLIENVQFRSQISCNAEKDIQNFTWDAYGKKLNDILLRISKEN